MFTPIAPLNWYALRVKSNREYITSQSLIGRGYEVFLPLDTRQKKGSASQVRAALLRGYLFCRFDANDRLPIVTLPGIVHIVGSGKTPLPVDERELESLVVLIRTGLPVRAEETYTVGQKIHIVRGPLAGANGVVAGTKDQRLVVSITLLQRSVSVLLEQEWLISAAFVDAERTISMAGGSCL
jgi:transcription antitermination factor NusG